MIHLLVFITLFAAILLIGRAAVTWWFAAEALPPGADRPSSPGERFLWRLVFCFTAGAALLSLVTSVVGHFNIHWCAYALGIGAALGLFDRRGRWLRPEREPGGARWLPPFGRLDWALLGCIALSAVLGLLGTLTPEVRHDPLFYHVQVPQLWLNAGRMIEVPENAHAYFPYGYEMLFTIALDFGSDSAAKGLHWLAGLMAAAWCGRICLSTGARPLHGAALFYFLPSMIYLSTTTYIDLATGMYGLAAVAVWLEGGKRGWSAPRAVLFGLFAGSAMATKYTAWPLLGLPLGVLSLITFRRRPALLLVTGVATLLPLAPWIVRNLVYVGNPVAPLLISVFGPETAHRTGLAGAFDSFAGARSGIALFVLGPVDHVFNLVWQKYTISLLGLLAGPAAWWLARRARSPWTAPAGAVALLLAGMYLCESWFTGGHPDGRYAITSMGLGAVLVAVLCSRLAESEGGSGGRACLLAPALAFLFFLSSLGDYRTSQRDLGERWLPILGAEARFDYMREHGLVDDGFEEREAHLDQAGAGWVIGLSYPSRHLYWSWIQGIRNNPLEEAGRRDAPPEVIARALLRSGVTHIINGTNPHFEEEAWEAFLQKWTATETIGGREISAIIAPESPR